MRIIAGEWRGRRLEAPQGRSTRPTADRVRETLFSMLVSRIGTFDGLRVADLYAGSGALGLEALSRGAAFACFVDSDRAALAAAGRNIEAFGAGTRARLLSRAVEQLPPAKEPFDLLFADPPYEPQSGSAALGHILRAGWARPGSWVAVETGRGDAVEPQGCAIDVQRDVGPARITLLRA